MGREVTSTLPTSFYLITSRSERDTIIAAKVGDIRKNRALSTSLSDIIGNKPLQVKGPQGTVIYSNVLTGGKQLSAYTQLGNWLFLARHAEPIVVLLKKYPRPDEIGMPGKLFSADGIKETAGIRFWGDNSGGELTALLKENQKNILIPIIKDPSQLTRTFGMFDLKPGRRMEGSITFIPRTPVSSPALKGDLNFIQESARRKLSALKIPYQGEVTQGSHGVTLKISIGDYLKAQPKLFKIQR
jgi:hypothetical protein